MYVGVSDNAIDSTSLKDRSEKLTTESNRKPVFTDCENYTPSVKEEQPIGTFVIKVHADDFDPVDAGGRVNYTIVSREGERTYFKINNDTGEIVTAMSFDRDEPIRQKELYVTVQATDNGRPPLADICTFKITVTDINDNAPIFDSIDYNVQVSEDKKPNSEVMRVFAYDSDDGENSRLTYELVDSIVFSRYFRIDSETGVIYLQDVLGKGKKDTKFTNTVIVSDNGNDNGEGPKRSRAEVSITVVGSDKQPPRIIKKEPEEPLVLAENFHDYFRHLVTVEAESGIADKEIVFELIKGKTTQTNKDQTFVLFPDNEKAYIRLARSLDYEMVTEYTLTVRVKNKNFMDTSINIPIKIEDVNDEIPNFLEFLKGSVVENDSPGAQAMTVRAIDKDGTAAHNQVSYELVDSHDVFSIDRKTGLITSKVMFDRENISLYHVKVMAYDNSPSAVMTNSTEPNKVVQAFQISIEDQNDNKPIFIQPVYYFSNISESANRFFTVGEVKAVDRDTASLITYSIIEGNIESAFFIEGTTGRIKVHNKLDFELIEQYEMKVRAFDGKYEDFCRVVISILNENDERPIFENHTKEVTFQEETLVEGCIITMTAYDPDIKNRSADQHIVYEVDKKEFLTVTKTGCVQLTKPLDRDLPYGSPTRQVFIYAVDNDGTSPYLDTFTEILIVLEDINDNAPFLKVTEIVWNENQDPGLIGKLIADDYDSPENGPPFTFELSESNSPEIKMKFSIHEDNLYAQVVFDREEKKYYDILITITDSGIPPQSGTSILRVIIGDVNDNEAKDGESSIFVYKYVNGPNRDIEIGRVFVEDPDDWDLPDKVFVQQNSFDEFTLSSSNIGMILMRPTTVAGTYTVNYEVTETHEPNIPRHTVNAIVRITVKEIIEEAVIKSGSIRMQGSSIEEFIEESEGTGQNALSRKDILQQRISKILNTSVENVDVFTVIRSPNEPDLIDVRFSAHGSPYYAPERLNNKVTEHQADLENKLDVEFVMVGINACVNETVCPAVCETYCSCTNFLNISKEPAVVFTNRTSFVGVGAVVDPVCNMVPKVPECFNGGTPMDNGLCNCPEGFQGPHCEILAIGFAGDGWAMYPTFDAWNHTDIILLVMPQTETGLIFYAGPLTSRHATLSRDFISLELKNGYPLLRLNYGNTTKEIYVTENIKKLNDGATHKLRVTYSPEDVQIEIDDCKSQCTVWKSMDPADKGLLNVNGPLQLGGMKFKFTEEETEQIWSHSAPTPNGFYGCIRNLTYNGFYYNLGAPSDQYNSYPDCNYGVMQAITFGIDSNFLVAILVCVAILIILLLAVVVHRRKQDNLNEKDIDDTRENIINYEDEGGGECDTNYDLSVFRANNIVDEEPVMRENPDVPADISAFLDTKKRCDPDNLPYDDVRHYAYEGDGNSTGSLSSLASCTDEGDLKFNYLSNFGPRFRKLADMYGEDPSDEDSHDGGEESWC
ncbi:hypothetical protein NQ315_010072 [Exocentrus adspersus]|uniref:DE-cadherin n=1 Tax=Exocentrus adspersus TaxID=1586481 RepID=A0AAV8WAE5_9CUCU|nr:hypothetical protein NQ315_010072 [Exocentrus adspersus]